MESSNGNGNGNGNGNDNKNELDNFQSWKHPSNCPNPDSKFWNRRIQLQAYYHGLCDGRKRINEGP